MTLEPARKRAEWDAAHGRTTVVLSYPPSANRLWRNVGAKTLKSATYRTWLAEALALMRGQRPRPIVGSYSLAILVDRPDRRRRDLGNLLKATEDALTQGGVIEDDSLAQKITLEWSKAPPAKPGGITVTLERA